VGVLLYASSSAPSTAAACEREKVRARQDGAARLLLNVPDERYKYPRW